MAELYKAQLGELIKEMRRALGMTQADLARAVPVEMSQTVSRWERGERGPQDLDAVAAALHTTAAEMLAQLTPIGAKDRRRLQPTAGTQLDRIEWKLDEVLRRLEGDEPQEPPGDLGLDLSKPPPKPRNPRRTGSRKEPETAEDSD